jgi:outer membrane protein TolC
MLLPGTPIAPISGPPRPENDLGSAWGTVTGLLVQWEPFDFGLRRAHVAAAERSRDRAEATRRRTEFEIRFQAADSYLTVLAAERALAGATAAVERAQVSRTVVEALVQAGLRPGADLSRAAAELAAAETGRIQADEAIEAAQASFRQYVGAVAALQKLAGVPPPASPSTDAVHPLLAEQAAAVSEAEANRLALEKVWRPKFNLVSATYARGTGVQPDGILLGGANGLGPNIFNYGLGLTVTFPLLVQPGLRAQQAEAAAQRRAADAKARQVAQDLTARQELAGARLNSARRILAKLPALVDAARDAERQSLARYRAGLGNIGETAEAQRMLAQAETDLGLAELAVWRASLQLAAARGDLEPFLKAAQ